MGDIHGRCDEAFTAVRATFEQGFRERDEVGVRVTALTIRIVE